MRGKTDVEAGVLDPANAAGLGQAAGGTVVARGAALDVEGGISVPEPLTLFGSGPDGAGALDSVAGYNLWTGPITLATGDATIGVAGGSTLTLRGIFDGPGGLTKVGLGFLVEGMFAANTYAGATTITAGSVLLDTVGGVAVPGALVIDPSAGSGTVTVGCGRDNRTAPTSTLTIAGSGVLDLMNHSITFASLVMDGGTISTRDRGELDLGGDVTAVAGTTSTITGYVSLGQATRTVTVGAGGVLTIAATVDGGGGLTERGAGRLVVSGDDTSTGTTSIAGGTLTVNGTLAGGVVVEPGGTLDGLGSIGSLVARGGTVRPGDGSGSLTVTGDVVLGPGSTLSATLNSSPHLDRSTSLIVDGTVRLEGATLSVRVSFPPTWGLPLTLIRNEGSAPVAGSFSGLPEGATLVVGGQTFRISYDGAGGDVVLTDLAVGAVMPTAPTPPMASGQRVVLRVAVLPADPGGRSTTAVGSKAEPSISSPASANAPRNTASSAADPVSWDSIQPATNPAVRPPGFAPMPAQPAKSLILFSDLDWRPRATIRMGRKPSTQ
jgi:autotransporter-associated beta strand protein